MKNAFFETIFDLSIQQLIILLLINSIGIMCVILLIISLNKPTLGNKERIILSIKSGLISLVLFAVVLGNIAFSLWIKTPNSRPILFVILATLFCGIPFIFPLVTAGSLIQLNYRDMWKEYMNSKKVNRE